MLSRVSSRAALSLIVAGLLAGSLASCAGDGSDLLNLDKTWRLQSVQDSPLPYTVPNADHDIVITSASADLGADNSYTTTFTGTTDGVQGTISTDHGSWSVSRSTLNFHSVTFHTDYIAALSGNTYLATVPGTMIGSTTANFSMVFTDAQ